MKVKGNGTVRPVLSVVPNSWQLILELGKDPDTKKIIQKRREFKGSKAQAEEALNSFKNETNGKVDQHVEQAKIQKTTKPVKNSWQLTLSLGYDTLTKKRKQVCRLFRGTKTEARRALEDFRREIESGLKVDADKVTFGEYADQWVASREASGRLAPATIVRNKEILRHLTRHLASVPLTDIDAPTVRNLYITLTNEGVGQPSRVKAAVILKQILHQAVVDSILLQNPCDFVEAPKQKKSTVGKALDKKGVARLMAALNEVEQIKYPLAKPQQQKATANLARVTLVRLVLATGLRSGEALGLNWNDIDLDNSTLKVSKTLDKVTGKMKAPKTESSVRLVSLDARIIADLKRWKNVQAKYLLSLGICQSKETPVITNEAGEQTNSNNLARWWRAFRKKYKFEGLRLHDLRHSHATNLISSRVNPKTVSSRLGHASVGITLDLYAHAQREDDEEAAEIMGQIMAEPAPSMGRVVNLQQVI